MSQEHVFGDWANQILPGNPNSRRHHRHVKISNIENILQESVQKTRKMGQGHVGHTKCYDVCLDCNTGWMGSLEGSAKKVLSDYILGKKNWLTVEECQIVSVWSIKAFLALEHSYRELVVINNDERNHFYDGYINKNWSILVGRYKGIDKAVYKIESRRLFEYGEEIPEKSYLVQDFPKEFRNTLIGTYIRGDFLIHVCRTNHSLCNYINLKNQPLYEDFFLERIWPLPASDIWLSNLPFINRDLLDDIHFREINWMMHPQYEGLNPPNLLPVASTAPQYIKIFDKDLTGKNIKFL